MSFVKNLLDKMSANVSDDNLDSVESDSEDTQTETSTDTGIATSGSDLDSSNQLESTDCSAISNFFGYWLVTMIFFLNNI